MKTQMALELLMCKTSGVQERASYIWPTQTLPGKYDYTDDFYLVDCLNFRIMNIF